MYLLGAAGGEPGRAALVPAVGLAAAAEPAEIPLPALRLGAGDVLDGFVSAYTAVIAAQNPATENQDPATENQNPATGDQDPATGDQDPAAGGPDGLGAPDPAVRWRGALDDVCEWAWPAAVRPILGRDPDLGTGPPAPRGADPGRGPEPGPVACRAVPARRTGLVRYALQDMVVSYAASGRQLLEVAGRPALPLESSPVVVGDPTGDLEGALREAQAILSQHYPDGRYLGLEPPGWDRPADGPGTPAEVLGELPAASRPGASMLHLGCHGVVAGSAPGRSHLTLAGHAELRVDAILRQASGRPPSAPGGLVTLAACTSDLSAGEV